MRTKDDWYNYLVFGTELPETTFPIVEMPKVKCADCSNSANSPDKVHCFPHYFAHRQYISGNERNKV